MTSPPYNCGKDYGIYDDSVDVSSYFQFIRDVFARACLHEGARVAVNIPWWIGKKPRYFTIPDYVAAVSPALIVTDKVIWVKGSESGLRGDLGTGWGTWLSPSGPSIRCASEPILIFVKGSRGRGRVSGAGRGACVAGDMTKDEFLQFTSDVWMVQGRSDSSHPAVFPPEIPRRLIKLYTYIGETILDPFMGIGTSIHTARQLERKAIGIEIEERYCEIAANRLRQEVLQFA